ncbi:MAG: C-type polyheme cytochrome OmcC [Anaerolineales bacterium]
MNYKKVFILLGVLVLAAAVLTACGGAQPAPTAAATAAPEVPAAPAPVIPYVEDWQASGHNNVTGEQFRHWDDAAENPDGVPTSCAKCHTTAGYQDFLGADGSEAGKVDAAVPAADAQGVQCVACHNSVTMTKTSVVFPSGAEVNVGRDARCMECHQGRESKVSIDKFIATFGENVDPDKTPAPVKDDKGNDVKLGFKNVHYFAAAATLYGGMAQGGYQYDGKTYDSKNTHTEGYDTCTGCHNPHTLAVKVEQCAMCHEDVATVDDLKNIRMVASNPDYDGDGDVKEGMYYEIQGLQEILLAQITEYAKTTAGAEIKYNADVYPYFMGLDDKAYPNWTPRLLKAAYNYQVSIKDPGAYAHGNKYIVQLLVDSIEDMGGDVSKLARTDAGHFAGDTMPFRDWDGEGYTVPFGCVKCHTATGLPTFLKSGGTTVVTATGTTVTTGLSSMPSSNGFMCSTCHDEANWPNRYAIASVTFPSGKTVSMGGKDADGKFIADDANVCISCHMGRESTTSLNNALRGKDADAVDAKISFKNVHYFAAGATLFGGETMGAYQYEGKAYVGQNMHADPAGKMNKCQDCHDVHALQPKTDTCETCHDTQDVLAIRGKENTTDYDGDGDVTEGIKGEIDTLSAALLAQIQQVAAANGAPIVYDAHSYPYFMNDTNANGVADPDEAVRANGYKSFSPRLLRAAFNYQYSQKDPGAFVHNPQYIMQVLIDSIEDLGGDVTMYTRPEAPAAK